MSFFLLSQIVYNANGSINHKLGDDLIVVLRRKLKKNADFVQHRRLDHVAARNNLSVEVVFISTQAQR